MPNRTLRLVHDNLPLAYGRVASGQWPVEVSNVGQSLLKEIGEAFDLKLVGILSLDLMGLPPSMLCADRVKDIGVLESSIQDAQCVLFMSMHIRLSCSSDRQPFAD